MQVARVVGGKLPNVKLQNCHTDLLFFLFYSYQEDYLQLVAANLLFERGWRYHKLDLVWLARWPGVNPDKKTVEWEEGLYQYFDVKVWRRIPGWFRLNYDQLGRRFIFTCVSFTTSFLFFSREIWNFRIRHFLEASVSYHRSLIFSD